MFMRKLSSQVVCDYNDPVAQTTAGKVRGVKLDSTYIFRGVPYAKAKRFHFPEAPDAWEGIREAITYGYVSPELNTPVPHDAFNVPHFWVPQDEDCLNLNIWTQTLDPNAKKPVMVWMHGGGWFSGSSVEIYSYDGENLSIFGDVTVVSINHRLNVIGFLDLSAYGEEYKYSANCGLADLVEALKWINKNIANFGGDPENVTIMGQSGGGAKVLSMLQTPAADGLFHHAIMQSGGAGHNGNPKEKEMALRMAELTLKYAGIEPENVKELESIHYYDLADAAAKALWVVNNEFGTRFNWGPQTDGDYYKGHPLEFGWREESKQIPILCGSVFGESMPNFAALPQTGKNTWDEATVMGLLTEKYGDAAREILDTFKVAYPEKNICDAYFVDNRSRKGVLKFVNDRAKVEGAAPIYSWLFNLESPWMNGVVAWHNAEEPYMFHNAQYIEAAYIPGVSEKLQDQMTGAWVSFAKTGNPNHCGIPTWDPVSADVTPTMLFDEVCRVGMDHDKKLMEILPNPDNKFSGSGIMAAIFGIEPDVKY